MKLNSHLSIKITLVALLLCGAYNGKSVFAQDSKALRNLEIDDYFSIKSVGSPSISPDGASVVYTVTTKDLENNRSD